VRALKMVREVGFEPTRS